MNDKQLDNKVRQDATKVKNDMNILVGDSAAQFDRFGDNLSQSTDKAKGDLTTWAEDGVSQIS